MSQEFRDQINKIKKFLGESSNPQVNNDLINIGDKVSYEKKSEGYFSVGDHRVSRKILKNGVIIDKIASINNMAPKFIVKDDLGNTDEIFVGDVVSIN